MVVNYDMLDEHLLKKINEEKCKEIGKYLDNTGLYISTDWEVDEYNYPEGHCMFMFDSIENLGLSVFNSKVNKMYVNSSVINDGAIFDSYANSFFAYGSTIRSFGTDHCEIENSVIDNTQIDNLKLEDVDIAYKLEFKNTTAGEIKGQVNKV